MDFMDLGYMDMLSALSFLPAFFHKLGKRSYLGKLGFDNLEVVSFGGCTILFCNDGHGVNLLDLKQSLCFHHKQSHISA